MMKFDGKAKKPKILESMKNIQCSEDCAAVFSVQEGRAVSRTRFPPRCVARFGVIVRRIKAGQLHAILDFAEHPTFIKLVLGAFVGDEFQHRLRNDDRAVVVGHDHIAGKNCASAAADRLLPADKGQAR